MGIIFYCKHEHRVLFDIVVPRMQKLSVDLINMPIVSLRTGAKVGIALRPLINPDNLKIEAWYATSVFENGILLLPTIEIREISRLGVAVNDHDSITQADELVRFKNLLKVDFQLLNKPVFTDSRQKLGKVEDYSTDLESFYIQKFYVKPPLLKSITQNKAIISRTQIIEITDKKIIVKGPEVKLKNLFGAKVREAEA